MKVISFIDGFISPGLHQDFSSLNRARIIVASGILLFAIMLILVMPVTFFSYSAGMITFNLFITILYIAVPFILKKTGSILVSGNIIVASGYVLITAGIISSGGPYSLTAANLSLTIIFSFMLTGFRSGCIWAAITFVTLGIVRFLATSGTNFGERAPDSRILTSAVILMAFVAVAAAIYELTGSSNAKRVKEEQDATMKLMNNQKKLLDDTIEVMAAVGQGDLTKGISVDIDGELMMLKKTVNQALNMLKNTLLKMAEGSTNILLASQEMNKASQSMAEGTSQQAASLEEISSSINEIDSVAKGNEESAMQAQQLSNQAMTETNRSNTQMEAMLTSMGEINESSNSVSKVIKVIDEIAFQTNLLALNAAVEAARAGKYGKGFAVVAEEVRNLASRSSDAAKDTTSLIESSINQVDSGVKNADQTAEILKGFVTIIEKVNDLVGEISSASREQSTGVGEISKSLNLVNEVVQKNSSISEQTAAASEELKSQAEDLKHMIGQFKLGQQNRTEFVQPMPEQAPPQSQPKLIPTQPKPKQLPKEGQKNQIVLDDDDFGKY